MSSLRGIRRVLERIYARKLLREISGANLPGHVFIIMGRNPENLEKILEISRWAEKAGIEELTFYSESRIDAGRFLNRLKKKYSVEIIGDGERCSEGKGRMKIRIFYGIRGREEIIRAVRKIARDVLDGKMKPEEIDDEKVKEYLIFRSEPDLIIRTGGSALADALIWQSVYSELYFTEASWDEFREIDFLRAIRDYQKRERRFGR